MAEQQNRAQRRSKKREKGEPLEVPFNGETYTVMHVDDWPLRTLGMLNRGEIEEVLTIIMDEENADKFQGTDPTVGDANEFFDVVKEKGRAGN